MHFTDIPAQEINHPFLAPPDALTIVALERQKLHEKIAHLRALREAAAEAAERAA
jgi:hypothetical protein